MEMNHVYRCLSYLLWENTPEAIEVQYGSFVSVKSDYALNIHISNALPHPHKTVPHWLILVVSQSMRQETSGIDQISSTGQRRHSQARLHRPIISNRQMCSFGKK